jgi:hypothetical protein
MAKLFESTTIALSIVAAAAGFAPRDAEAQNIRGAQARPDRSICVDALNKDPSFMTPYSHLNKALGITGNTGCEADGTDVVATFNMNDTRQMNEYRALKDRYARLNANGERQAQNREAQQQNDPLGGVRQGAEAVSNTIQTVCSIGSLFGKPCR